MTGWVLHVDMDQFIAAVELLRRPELRGRPVRTAVRRCPEAVFLAVDRELYEAFLSFETDDPEGWGIGSKTAKRLRGMGISTVLELAQTDPQALAAAVGPKTGPWLVRLAQGRASATVVSAPYVARSHSREITFQQDLEDWDRVRREVDVLVRRATEDVVAEHRRAVRVVVKVRYAPFTTFTHGRALSAPSTDVEAIGQAAQAALDAFTSRDPVRLLGVRAELEG